MNKTTAIILLLSAMGATASERNLTPEVWGSDLTERWWDSGKLSGIHIRYVGGIEDNLVSDKLASISPWQGAGDPDPDYVVARGTVWMWGGYGGTEPSGYNWTTTADGKTVRKPIPEQYLVFPPTPVSYFWGVYGEGKRYLRAGGVHCGVENRSHLEITVTVAVEWYDSSYGPSHWTKRMFYVYPGQIGHTYPQPLGAPYGWASDSTVEMNEL